MWKASRKLNKAKKYVTKELKNRLAKDKIEKLKIRKRLIIEAMEKAKRNKMRSEVDEAVKRVKKSGGVDSNTFWEFKRKCNGEKNENTHAIKDQLGIKQEDPQKILSTFEDYYTNLLTPPKAETDVEKECEDTVNRVIRGMELIRQCTDVEEITREEIGKVLHKLKNKKAGDNSGWNNELLEAGGEEIEDSLTNIFGTIGKLMMTPREWEDTTIKSIHKGGSHLELTNQEDLFLTNTVSKVFERVIINRNSGEMRKGVSEWQTGGVFGRSTIDSVMKILAIIERNKYFNKDTYITFADTGD